MNKQLILDNKECFDHWLAGGKTRYSVGPIGCWNPVDNLWSTRTPASDFLIVIDDKYVEFRKALAEGKTIQLLSLDEDEWLDDSRTDFGYPVNQYRIKPDEFIFSLGDWVRVDGRPLIIDGDPDRPAGCSLYFANIACKRELIELWEPKPGEWCWFWDEEGQKPTLNKLEVLSRSNPRYITRCDLEWVYCEPFIGTLPTNIKD